MMYSGKIFDNANAGDEVVLIGTILLGVVTVDGVYSFSLITDGKVFIIY